MRIICWLFGHRWSAWGKVSTWFGEVRGRECFRCHERETQFRKDFAIGQTVEVKMPERWQP
jgi:hypothetical protein